MSSFPRISSSSQARIICIFSRSEVNNACGCISMLLHGVLKELPKFVENLCIFITTINSSVVAVPARIVSFSREIVTPWKKDITLPCIKVGIPVPQAIWRLQDRIMETNGRKQVCVIAHHSHLPLKCSVHVNICGDYEAWYLSSAMSTQMALQVASEQ